MTDSPPNLPGSSPAPAGDSPLDWEAFRYIAGEMDAAESARFEQRLQEDLAACAAVADAVSLTAQLHDAWEPVAERRPTPQTGNAPPDRFRTFHFYRSAALWLAILMGGWLLVQAAAPTQVAHSGSEPLAAAWADLVTAGDFELEEPMDLGGPDWAWVDQDETDWMLVALQDLQTGEGDIE